MGEFFGLLRRYLDQIVAFWQSLDRRRKITLIVTAIAAFAAISGFTWQMNQVAWRPLYVDLTETESASAVERLAQLQVPYKLAQGGRTILVAEGRLDEVRIALAGEGLPQSGRLGFELFDRNSFGATEFAEQVNFRRALEGELERSVESLEEVRRARVHIRLPKRSVFLDEEEPGKASVVVELAPQQKLSAGRAKAIVHLISSAVEGLDPEKVTIMDSTGRLFADGDAERGDINDRQLEYKRKLENETSAKILRTLEPHLGPGGMRANVWLEVDWDKGEQTKELLDPSTVMITTQRSEERAVEGPPRGAPGAASNLPRTPLPPEQTAEGLTRTMETTNYETSRTVTRMDLERGTVRRMSIAVMVDYQLELDETESEVVRRPRPAAELAVIRELVVAAAGAKLERGDTVTVESLPFTMLEPPVAPPPPPPDPSQQIFTLEWLHRYRLYLIGVVVGAALLYGLWMAYQRKRRLAKVRAERQAAIEAEREREELEEASRAEAEKRQADEARMLQGLKLATAQNSRAQVLKKHLEESATSNPEAFSRLIRAWVHEDD